MAGLNINPTDLSRDQYLDYNEYMARRQGDRYYNLGYTIYKGLVLNPNEPGYISPTTIINGVSVIETAFTNFTIALLFKKVDESSKKKEVIYVIFLDQMELFYQDKFHKQILIIGFLMRVQYLEIVNVCNILIKNLYV